MTKSPITCHVLNASVGKPAEGMAVSLECLTLTGKPEASPGRLGALATGVTDKDGRCTTLLSPDTKLLPGVYKMIFYTGAFFQDLGQKTFYPLVEITFSYEDPSQHYHIPLLLSPFSYTTYRGS